MIHMQHTADSTAGLAVRGLGVCIGRRTILEAIDLEVRPGEIVAVIGPNGAGKTTLLEAIAGLRPVQAGTVAVDGRVLDGFAGRATSMSYMPDAAVLPEETTIGAALGLRAGTPLVSHFDIASLLEARATTISRGEAKRAELCAAMALGRRVVLLDEPFGAFDPRQLRAIVPVVRSAVGDSAVVVTVHQMNVAELLADRIMLVANGRALACGALADLQARAGAPRAPLDEVFVRLLDGARHALH